MKIITTTGHQVEFDNIGHIRAKQMTDDPTGTWELEIWPPQHSHVFADGSTMAECEVSFEEAARIEAVAPHLMLTQITGPHDPGHGAITKNKTSARKAQEAT